MCGILKRQCFFNFDYEQLRMWLNLLSMPQENLPGPGSQIIVYCSALLPLMSVNLIWFQKDQKLKNDNVIMKPKIVKKMHCGLAVWQFDIA